MSSLTHSLSLSSSNLPLRLSSLSNEHNQDIDRSSWTDYLETGRYCNHSSRRVICSPSLLFQAETRADEQGCTLHMSPWFPKPSQLASVKD